MKPTFTIRPLTSQKKSHAHILQSFLLWFLALPCFVVALSYWPYQAVAFVQRELGVIPAQALSFEPKLPEVQITLPVPTGWQAPKEPAYKNERLLTYQGMLRERGITNPDHLRLFASQLLVENGAISEDRDGDPVIGCIAKDKDGNCTKRGVLYYCSIGIPQRNVCNFGYTTASFRRKFPAWNDWRVQMDWMTTYTAASYARFDGKAKCTIIYHNRPASALNGCRDTKAGYYGKIVSRSTSLTAL